LSTTESETITKAKETLQRGGLKALRFPKGLEAAFDEYYFTNTLKHLRVALLTGLFLFVVFGLVDRMLFPADRAHMWFIRYAVICPTIIAGFFFTYTSGFKRFMQPAIWLVMLVASLGIVVMVHFEPTPETNYYSGLLLLIMAAFSFMRMRFLYAISWASITILAYETVAILSNLDFSILMLNTFNLMGTLIIGAFSNYLMENYLRRDFVNSVLLESENRQLQEVTRELRRLSNCDALTNLGNRRHFEQMLEQEWLRAMRTQTPVSLILLDIDFFKHYNDSYGHQAGDECLQMVAEEIGGFTRRPGDTAARYGGEEFVLILPGTDLIQAASIAEACRACVESMEIAHNDSKVHKVVTVSAGVATLVPEHGISRRSLVAAADKALYQAKREGRNRVVLGRSTAETEYAPVERNTEPVFAVINR